MPRARTTRGTTPARASARFHLATPATVADHMRVNVGVTGHAQRPPVTIPWRALFQLAAFATLLYLFRVESESLFRILVVALAGFVVGALAGPARRHWVFLATSVVGGSLTVGVPATLAIASVASAIVAVSRLRTLRPRWRVLSVIGILVAFGVARAWTPLHPVLADRLGLDGVFWAIAGSVFAFRALIFVYDTIHGVDDVPLPQQLAYFVLLPNFALPLFPIIDYRTFVDSHTLEPKSDDYDAGGRLLLVGFGHLIAYRLVYHYLVTDTSGPLDPIRSAMYVVSFYLLYLRVSGLFHVVIGLLHFFGYRLPPTHHRHLLSQSFGDFWRRTNSYWKDFNQKFVFSPLAAALERRLERGSLQVAVFLSLVISWAIHSYQFFWLFGRPFLDLRDVVFWLVLGVAMVIATTRELGRRSRGRLGPKPAPTARERIVGGLRTAGFFTLIAVLWSFWSAPSWAAWAHAIGLRRP